MSVILLISAFPSSILEDLCSSYLGIGAGKVSDELISLKSYASNLARREPGRLQVLYDRDYTTLAYRGRNLPISNLQNGLNDLISETWGRMLVLSGGTKIPIEIPFCMSEDVETTDMGRSFIHELRTTPPTLPLLYEMSKLQNFPLFRRAEAGAVQNFELDPSSAQEFFHTLKPIVESIAFLLQVTGSGPLRMSEVVGDRYSNGTKKRNLFVSHGRVFLLRTDLKTSPRAGMRSQVVHHPPPKVTELLVYYLSVVRPLEIFLSGSLGWTDQYAAYSQFIYVIKGSVVTPRGFSDIISTYTDRYFGCRLSGLDLRHVLISIQDTFIRPIVDPSVQKIGDTQAGHSTMTAITVYGQRIGHLNGILAQSFNLAEDWCRRLHKILGVGPDPPSPPIPIVHAPSEPTWWSPSEFIPSNSNLDNIVSNLHSNFTTTVVGSLAGISRTCEKTFRESAFEAVATWGGASGFPVPSQTPGNGEPMAISDLFCPEANPVSLKVDEALTHGSHTNLTISSRPPRMSSFCRSYHFTPVAPALAIPARTRNISYTLSSSRNIPTLSPFFPQARESPSPSLREPWVKPPESLL
jgi:hypothetical protein